MVDGVSVGRTRSCVSPSWVRAIHTATETSQMSLLTLLSLLQPGVSGELPLLECSAVPDTSRALLPKDFPVWECHELCDCSQLRIQSSKTHTLVTSAARTRLRWPWPSCCLLELHSSCQHEQKAWLAGIHHETQLCERAGTKEYTWKAEARHWAVRNARQHSGKKSFCHSVYLAVPTYHRPEQSHLEQPHSVSQGLPGSGKTTAQARHRNHLEEVQSIKPF